jgi:serine/threonine protein kinase
LEEYRAALEAGHRPDRQVFLARHAEIAEALADCVDGLDFVHAVAPALSDIGTGRPASDADTSTAIPRGTPLGDFRILREIGRGGMGVVYEAEQLSLGRRVALKVLPFAAAMDAKRLQRFKNEAQAAAHLRHQNIVPVYGVGCERGVHFYAMQYIEGQTLARVIADLRLHIADLQKNSDGHHDSPTPLVTQDCQPIPSDPAMALTPPVAGLPTERSNKNPAFFRTVANLAVQAAEALEHAHQLGIIHRDIKPANLLIETNAPLAPSGERGRGEGVRLWITDFGLAHCQSQPGLTMTGDLVGTLRYMSPEQALAKRVAVDARTDV